MFFQTVIKFNAILIFKMCDFQKFYYMSHVCKLI